MFVGYREAGVVKSFPPSLPSLAGKLSHGVVYMYVCAFVLLYTINPLHTHGALQLECSACYLLHIMHSHVCMYVRMYVVLSWSVSGLGVVDLFGKGWLRDFALVLGIVQAGCCSRTTVVAAGVAVPPQCSSSSSNLSVGTPQILVGPITSPPKLFCNLPSFLPSFSW